MNTAAEEPTNNNRYVLGRRKTTARRKTTVRANSARYVRSRRRYKRSSAPPSPELLAAFGGELKVSNFDNLISFVESANDKKFYEFMSGRAYELLESETPNAQSLINQSQWLFGQRLGMNLNFNPLLFIVPRTRKSEIVKYNDPINEAIHQHYKQKLRNIPNLNLMEEINDFLKLYFLKPQKIKVRTPKKTKTKQFTEMAERGLNAAQITDKLAKEELESLVSGYLKSGSTEKEAKFMAGEDLKVWKVENGKRIRETLRYHGFAKREMKTAEKLMPNFLKQKKGN